MTLVEIQQGTLRWGQLLEELPLPGWLLPSLGPYFFRPFHSLRQELLPAEQPVAG